MDIGVFGLPALSICCDLVLLLHKGLDNRNHEKKLERPSFPVYSQPVILLAIKWQWQRG